MANKMNIPMTRPKVGQGVLPPFNENLGAKNPPPTTERGQRRSARKAAR